MFANGSWRLCSSRERKTKARLSEQYICRLTLWPTVVRAFFCVVSVAQNARTTTGGNGWTRLPATNRIFIHFAVSWWHLSGPAGLCLVRSFASIRDEWTNGRADCYNNAPDPETPERPLPFPGFRGSSDWNALTDEPERAEVKRAATRKCRRRSTRRGRPVRLELLALELGDETGANLN